MDSLPGMPCLSYGVVLSVPTTHPVNYCSTQVSASVFTESVSAPASSTIPQQGHEWASVVHASYMEDCLEVLYFTVFYYVIMKS